MAQSAGHVLPLPEQLPGTVARKPAAEATAGRLAVARRRSTLRAPVIVASPRAATARPVIRLLTVALLPASTGASTTYTVTPAMPRRFPGRLLTYGLIADIAVGLLLADQLPAARRSLRRPVRRPRDLPARPGVLAVRLLTVAVCSAAVMLTGGAAVAAVAAVRHWVQLLLCDVPRDVSRVALAVETGRCRASRVGRPGVKATEPHGG